MQFDFSVLSASEQKSRKLWIRSLCICCGLGVVLFLSMAAIPDPRADKAFGFGAAAGCILIYVVLPAYIFYYCSYKKAGTKLLTYHLWTKPPLILFFVVCSLQLPLPYNFLTSVLVLIVFLFFYRLNWRLREVNRKLRLNAIYPEEYVLQGSNLSMATTKEELDAAYASLVKKWPQFEKKSTLLYKQTSDNFPAHLN